ncbi:MAG: MATE family efflux transporter [Cystobacterineae bacterium]|nr:MATE family efflux transporter [Cystobacterineae bacterium]
MRKQRGRRESLRLWNQEFWGLFYMATPLALAQAGLAFMGLVDMLVVSQVSDLDQAAVGLGNALFFTFAVFGMATMMAVDPLVSQAIGAKEPSTARTHFWQGLSVSLVGGLLLCLPLLACIYSLERFNIEPELAKLSRNYVLARLWSLPAMLLFSNCRAYFQGLGLPRRILQATLVSNLFNVVAVLALVHGFGPIPPMGATGAGLATGLCTWIGLWAILRHGLQKKPSPSQKQVPPVPPVQPVPPPPRRRPSWASAKGILKLGIPIGLQAAAECTVFTLVGMLAGTMSQTAAAAHQVAMTWMSFSFCFALGLGNAASVRIGWAIGRNDLGALRRTGAVAMASALTLMAPWAAFFSLFPHWPAGLTAHSTETMALAMPLFVIGGLFQLMDGLSAVSSGLLRGTGDTRSAFYVTTLGYYAIATPLGAYLAFSKNMGVHGLWWGLAAGVMLMGPALALRFFWRTSKPLARI